MRYVRGCILLVMMSCLLLVHPPAIHAQSTDSLVAALQTAIGNDTLQARLCESLSAALITVQPAQARAYAIMGLNLTGTTGYDRTTIMLLRNAGAAYTLQGRYDSGEYFLQKAHTAARKLADDETEALVQLSLGTLFTRQKKNDLAMASFMAARDQFEKSGNKTGRRKVAGNIAALFMYQHNFAQAEHYYEEAEKLSRETNDASGLGHACSGRSHIYKERGEPDKALEYALQSAEAFGNSGERAFQSVAYREIAAIYLDDKDVALAEKYGRQSLLAARETGLARYIANALCVMSDISFQQTEYDSCATYASEALASDSTDSEVRLSVFGNLMKCHTLNGNYAEALQYFELYKKEIDLQVNEKYQVAIADMEVRYETEKKELTIQNLHQRGRITTFIWLSALLFMALIVLALFYRQKVIVSKKELAEQKIIQLEKEKQVIAARALLAGEETERSRLAGDLHDGLGGLLTGVKIKLSSMKEPSIMTSENLENFKHALELLDTSISEMRRVAHNLMPETLIRYGLKTALTDFMKQIAPDGPPVLHFNAFGEDLRYGRELEITVYRIAQELVTNALKHASASRIDAQLFAEATRICIQVTDDGKGMNQKQIREGGQGLRHISDRVTAYNGRFEIVSQPGEGTECMAEFLIVTA